MAFVYGKQLSFTIRPFAGDDSIEAYELVSARLYSSSPSTSQEQDYNHALGDAQESITSWTSEGNAKYKVIFSAVNDPDQSSAALYDTWYVVTSLRLEASKQVQFITKAILIWRLTGQLSHIDVETVDIYTLDSGLEYVLDEPDVYGKIRAAQDFVLHKVKFLGLDRYRLNEYDLSLAVRVKAIELCYRSMAGADNDYSEQATHWRDEYEGIWKETRPGYDANNDGITEPSEKISTVNSIRIIH